MFGRRPTKLRSQRDINLWRIPLQLSLAAVALFGITLIPDILDKYGVIRIPWWMTMGSIDDARAILSATMGAVATVLALIFSVALLVLSMVATLFGPSLLYRFLQDWVTQVTIGLFMGTFVYIWRMRGMSSKRRGKEYAPAVWRLYFDTWGVAPRLFQCPERGNSMKRLLAVICFVVVAVAPILLVTDAWARAGGGSSGGSRGSRSYSSPTKPAPTPMTPSQPSSPASPAPQRPGWGGGLMGGLAGFALGGLLGSMLFGHGMGGGFGGGFGLLEMLLIGGGIFLLVRMFRNRQPQFAPPSGPGFGGPTWQGQSQAYEPAPTAPMAGAAPEDLGRGVAAIRQMDGSFDPARFGDQASDVFFKVQAAWITRDMRGAGAVLTPEMTDILQKDSDRLRAQGRVNHLENIAVRSVTLTEAWQEGGQDYVTVRFLASLLDYTVEEASGQVVEGSRSEPVKFEEYWTFARPVGPNPWRLSAIQQA